MKSVSLRLLIFVCVASLLATSTATLMAPKPSPVLGGLISPSPALADACVSTSFAEIITPEGIQGIYPFAIGLIVLALTVVGIGYAYGLSTNNARIISWAQSGFAGIVIACVLLVASLYAFNAICGDVYGELPSEIPASVVATCGNSACESGSGEDSTTCPIDCGYLVTAVPASGGGTTCGNGVCDGGETSSSCPSDCVYYGTVAVPLGAGGPSCGNGQCEVGESSNSCPDDCTWVEAAAKASQFSLLSDWRVIAVGMSMIMVIIVAIAYAAGIATDNSEIKAWAAAELTQVFVTVIVIIVFASVITFLDTFIMMVVDNSNLPFGTCQGQPQPCAIKTATEYLDGMIGLAEEQAHDRIVDSVNAGKQSSYRAGAYATQLLLPIPLLQLAISGSMTAGYIMDIDRNQVLLEHLGNLLSVMWSQRFFVNVICYKIAPLVLVLGIVTRAFFVTRKLGGLLIAMGIATMYVLPMMYVLNWITLSVTLYGDSILTPGGGACPAACLARAPLFYSGNKQLYEKNDTYAYFGISEDLASQSLKDQMEKLEKGTISSVPGPNGKVAYSCEYYAKVSVAGYGQAYCPIECRELPYPMAQTCMNVFNYSNKLQPSETTRKACSNIPDACRIIRYVNPASPYSVPPDIENQCRKECRTVPPLKPKCDNTQAFTITYLDERDNNKAKATSVTASCANARDYCLFTQRPTITDPRNRPDGCTSNGVQYLSSDIFVQGDKNKPQKPLNIAVNDSNSMACPASTTAKQSCLYVLPDPGLIDTDQCNGCLFVRPEYTFDPPIYANCAQLCNPGGSGPPKVNPAEFAQKTKEGMYGRPEIKSVAALYLPGYVLPILNILVTLMFVRTFSPILGGDIEIPGLARIL